MNPKEATRIVNDMGEMATRIQLHPELRPVAQWILGPVLNGALKATTRRKRAPARMGSSGPGSRKRSISAARRKELSRQAKARWAKAKKAGKNSIGGAD